MAKQNIEKIQITQVKSLIKRPKNQVQTIEALGLGKINKTVVKVANAQILGMVKTVAHLVETKAVK